MSDPTDDLLDTLLAKHAITEQLHAYCRGMDRIDLALTRSVFTADSVADYGAMFSGSGHGFADFIGEVHPPMQTHSHHLSNISISLASDRAGSEAYVIVRLRTGDGGTDLVSHGRYVDRWRREDGTWRIFHRRYLHTLDYSEPVVGAMFGTAGSRDRDDPSYDVLGNPGG